MISSQARFSLDVQKPQSQVSVPVMQGDTKRIFYISLNDGGQPYFIETGCLVLVSIKRPTGTFIQVYCTVIDNRIIVYDFSDNPTTAAVEGVHNCQITIYNGDGERLSTAAFSIVVNQRVVNRDDINLSDEDVEIIDAINSAEAARREAEIGRVNAEAERVAAEKERQEAFETFKNSINNYKLPGVSTSDNGKFLRVVDGQWAAQEIQNAGGVEF